MNNQNIEKLLNEMAEAAPESVNPQLADSIKQQIPHNLGPHRFSDTFNIIIDLRISKLAAAAVIIISLLISAHFLGSPDPAAGGIYKDGLLLIKYCFDGSKSEKSITQRLSSFQQYLKEQGKDAVYYGDNINLQDNNSILMHWKLPNGNYKLLMCNLREREVNSDELIRLQAEMLQKVSTK